MRLAFRVVVDSRDKRTEFTPQFVKDAGAKGFMNKGKWSPYSDDPVFQKYYTKFVKALAKDFNDPSKVEFIDGFGLGKWGEYHTMIYSTGDDTPKKAVFDWVTDIYSQAFDKVPVVINYHRWIGAGKDWVDDEHFAVDSEEMLEEAIKKGYSLRHDAFGMTTYYGSWERRFAKKYRNICPIIMEGGCPCGWPTSKPLPPPGMPGRSAAIFPGWRRPRPTGRSGRLCARPPCSFLTGQTFSF